MHCCFLPFHGSFRFLLLRLMLLLPALAGFPLAAQTATQNGEATAADSPRAKEETPLKLDEMVVTGYLYVALQEDGLPILSESNFRFTQADTFVRVTSFVDRIEALRGGSAGVFASSDPLGIINFITREGTRQSQGELTFQAGDHG